jgi:hypothetical protein
MKNGKKNMTSIELPGTLQDTYMRMAHRAKDAGRFIKIRKNGFVDANEEIIAEQLIVHIIDSEDYYYKWIKGDKGPEIEKLDINRMEYGVAKSKGWQLGILITFIIIKPDVLTGETLRCSLPEMSAGEFDRYAKWLNRRGLTPNHVYTRIHIQVVPTKKGGPTAKALFHEMGIIEPKPIDVTPDASSEKTSLPLEWETD